ncbi:MAG TPA: O-antigen ligase family protein [Baekduia sp.]|nr:O-antigen ligase family protein [Baekduia sp.]
MLERVGVVAVVVLLAWGVLGRPGRARGLALAASLGLTVVLLAGDVWHQAQVQAIVDRPPVAVALAALAGVVVVLATATALRRPEVVPVAAVAVLPFRVPLTLGGETANLLVPLYLVIAAGGLARVVRDLRSGDGAPAPPRPTVWLERLLFGFVVLYALQATYSGDLSKAVQNVAFFYVPFGVLFALLVETRWTRGLLRTWLGVLVGLALLFCAVAFLQEATHHVFLNDKLKESNAYNPYFRANSLFFDPNILGRFLVVVLLLVAPIAAWATDRRRIVPAVAVLVVVWLGLLTTLSQSSFGALLMGLAVLAGARWTGRRLAVAGGVVIGVLAVLVLVFPGLVGLHLDRSSSIRKATSGRSDLVSGAATLFADRPLTGWGSGAFSVEYRRERHDTNGNDVAASHTIPLTVAVEQGVVGLAVYVALLVAAFQLLLRGARTALARLAIGAAFAALVVHTLGYAAFLEDPMTWALLALGVALARRRERGREELTRAEMAGAPAA